MTTKNKILIIAIGFVLSLAFTFLAYAAVPAMGENEKYGETERFHMLANSDSQYDQNAKKEVYAEVLKYLNETVSDCSDHAQVCEKITNELDNIKCKTAQILKEHGYDYPVRAEFSDKVYTTRSLENSKFPAGKYKSLRIILGKGEGKNFWSVLYPAIAFSESACDSGFSEDAKKIIACDDVKIKIRFRFLELLYGKEE